LGKAQPLLNKTKADLEKGRTYTPYTRKGVYGVGEPCQISKVGLWKLLRNLRIRFAHAKNKKTKLGRQATGLYVQTPKLKILLARSFPRTFLSLRSIILSENYHASAHYQALTIWVDSRKKSHEIYF